MSSFQKLSRPAPPNQVWARKFVIYGALGIPEVQVKDWKLTVTGLVERRVEFTYDDLTSKMPNTKIVRDFNCLMPGSMVYANPEPTPIENVRVGDNIVGSDGRLHTVRKLIKRHHDGYVLGIKARYLPAVIVTPDHPVLVVPGHPGVGESRSKRRQKTFRSGFKALWKKAEELKIGDYVYFPKYDYVSDKKYAKWGSYSFRIDKKLASVLGWYVAEGCGADSNHKNITFCLNTYQTDEARTLKELVMEIFDANVSLYPHGKSLMVTTTSSKIGRLAEMLKCWCGEDARNKRIPDFVLNSEPTILREFLASYLKGDGYNPIMTKENANRYREDIIDFSTMSVKLAYQLVLALSKLGIAGMVVRHPGSVDTGYSVRVRGRYVKKLIPSYPAVKKIDKFHFWETTQGFYFPIIKLWRQHYSGPVFDLVADGYTMLSPFVTQDCVTQWSVADVEWEGVPFSEIAKAARINDGAEWVTFSCADGYTAPVPLEDAMAEDSVIALKMNGKPLSVQQGFPARPFIPHLYGWKSAKWLTGIEFVSEYVDGYWEMYGYHERGNIWQEERFKGMKGVHTKRKAYATSA